MNKGVLTFIVLLFLYSCESNNDFLILNNSDDEIIVVNDDKSFVKNKPLFMHSETWRYKEQYDFEFLKYVRIHAHSSDDRFSYRALFYEGIDTLCIAVFNLLDCDTLSFEEFKQKYPIKHEFKVTLQDMIDREWTLVYPPE